MAKHLGFNGKVLQVDLSTGESRAEIMSETWYRIYAGGGMLGAYFMLRDTEPGLDAFAADNRLIFASSAIAGQDGPGLARFSVVTKSPLSGGIAEARCEGAFGRHLKGSGYDALIVRGKAAKPVVLVIENEKAEFHGAEELWGLDTTAAAKRLEAIYGKEHTQIAVIGQAGENLVRFASIVTNYSVQAMRLGTGAVMGSKNLKAVVLKSCHLPAVADPAKLGEVRTYFQEQMPKNTLSMWQKNPPGFSASADLSDFETAYIGVDNYRSDLRVENSNYIRGKYMEYYQGAVPCPGCPNDCIKTIDPGMGYPEAAGIHQEVTGALGPNIGNPDLKIMLQANVLCNLYGLDPVSLGFTISFAMECFEANLISTRETDGKILKFGNTGDLLALIRDIAERKGFGDVLAEGSRRAAAKIGQGAARFAMQVKGIEMVSFEPRTQTNLALGYATAPIGPRYDICEHDWDFDVVSGWEHTLEHSRALGIYERVPMQYLGKTKVGNYKALNNLWSACDALNLCIFASAPTRLLSLEMIVKLIEAVTGWKTSAYEFMRWGERRNHLLRIYNLREGLRGHDDILPKRFFQEPISAGRLKGTVLDETEFKEAIKTYYEMMGWDRQGVPLPGTLYDHHLEEFLPLLGKPS